MPSPSRQPAGSVPDPHTRQTYLIGRFLDIGLSGVLVPRSRCRRSPRRPSTSPTTRRSASESWGGAAATARSRRQAAQPAASTSSTGTTTSSSRSRSSRSRQSRARSRWRSRDRLPGLGPNDLGLDLKRNPDLPPQDVRRVHAVRLGSGQGQGHQDGHGDPDRARGAREVHRRWA